MKSRKSVKDRDNERSMYNRSETESNSVDTEETLSVLYVMIWLWVGVSTSVTLRDGHSEIRQGVDESRRQSSLPGRTELPLFPNFL